MKPHGCPQEPCPKLWKLGGTREDGEGTAQACPFVPTCISRAGARVLPGRSPCNKPLHLPSSKDYFPGLPACLPAKELPGCPQLSLPPVHLRVLLFPAGTESQGSAPFLRLVEILGSGMGKGLTILVPLVSCTEGSVLSAQGALPGMWTDGGMRLFSRTWN